jgi:hypothetical protein
MCYTHKTGGHNLIALSFPPDLIDPQKITWKIKIPEALAV